MDSDILKNDLIYENLKDEFRFKLQREPYINWLTFIKSKDLGIVFNNNTDEYKIIDEKKWALNKIKYGF
jgi:hypothetical protein